MYLKGMFSLRLADCPPRARQASMPERQLFLLFAVILN